MSPDLLCKRNLQCVDCIKHELQTFPHLQNKSSVEDVLTGCAEMYRSRGGFILAFHHRSELLDERDSDVASLESSAFESLQTSLCGVGQDRRRQRRAMTEAELVKLQDWVVNTRHKVVILFEGRDAAGKGGVIKRITQRLNPRSCRVAALPAPNDRERTQWYFQRYVSHLPAGGEIVLFDRSWYNRAGVERVMGFCTDEEYERFLTMVPVVEREMIVNNGIILRKYFLDVSQDEQRRRFEARIKDPMKHWKLSPMDTESVRRWWDYTLAYQRMIEATHMSWAPWHIVPADNKRRARLNLIRHLLDSIPYKKVDIELPKIPKAQRRPKDATEGLTAGLLIPTKY
jgi:polyphosphate kinase 2